MEAKIADQKTKLTNTENQKAALQKELEKVKEENVKLNKNAKDDKSMRQEFQKNKSELERKVTVI